MARRELQREIGELEARLDETSNARVINELSRVRRGLASGGKREPAIALPNLRLGFACKQRWEDMVGDDRVRACGGCDRPVFNLSAMTREDAEAVLATRGLTPCVRFYRRPDGTVMTSDCPTGTRREGRKLAVVASSFAASTLAAVPLASADAPTPVESVPAESVPAEDATPADSTSDPQTPDPTADQPPKVDPVLIEPMLMGIPVDHSFGYEVGIIIAPEPKRPAVEWSTWTRLGTGVEQQPPTVLARSITPPMADLVSTSIWEAALGADLSFGIARDGNLRVGAWGELRTTSDAVAGVELVLAHLPPHPYSSRIGGTGSLVLRAGGNSHVVTGALGFGYIGSFPNYDPWVRWMRHVVGARVVLSMNRSTDDPRDWSATLGLEVEPLGAVHAIFDLATGHRDY